MKISIALFLLLLRSERSIACNPSAPRSNCKRLEKVPNHIKLENADDEKAEYVCKAELNLKGGGTLTCDATSGQWSVPKCMCSDPPTRHSAKIPSKRSDSASYECTSPLIGQGHITCNTVTGVWSEPICTCPSPTFSFADIVPQSSTTAKYQCKSNLKLSGTGLLTCDANTGKWNQPICTCTEPATLRYAKIVNKTANSLTYQCTEPLVGSGVAVCDPSTGVWSEAVCSCPEPNIPYIQSTRSNRTSVTYQCKSQLKLSGDGTLHCDLTTGRWSQPSCSCQQPTLPPFVKLIKQNNVINYECIGPLVGNGIITCNLLTGGWSTVNCKCRDPVLPEFASISSRTDNSISIACPNHLELAGSHDMVCDTMTGQWKPSSSQLPQCRCRAPNPPPRAVNERINPSTIKYICDKELKLFGPSLIFCNVTTGVWSASPECGCSDPSTVANAQMKRIGPITASYSCNNGLKLFGTATVQCDPRSNKWNGPLPRCSCQDPTPIANAVSQRIDSLTFIYRCIEGFELIGSSNISCNLASGQWGTLPACQCTPPLISENLRVSKRKNNSVDLDCIDGFELVGNSTVNCNLSNGLWDLLPECKKLNSSTPDSPSTDYDTSTDVGCDEDFDHNNYTSRICNSSSPWNSANKQGHSSLGTWTGIGIGLVAAIALVISLTVFTINKRRTRMPPSLIAEDRKSETDCELKIRKKVVSFDSTDNHKVEPEVNSDNYEVILNLNEAIYSNEIAQRSEEPVYALTPSVLFANVSCANLEWQQHQYAGEQSDKNDDIYENIYPKDDNLIYSNLPSQSASLSDVNCDESEYVTMQGAHDEPLYSNSSISPENKPKLGISSLNRK